MLTTRTHRLLSAVMLMAALTGCATSVTDPGPGRRVHLELDQQTYVAAAAVRVTVKNLTGLALTFPGDFCPAQLQVGRDGTWSSAVTPPSCPLLFLTRLQPKGSSTFVFALPSDLPSGSYRLVLPPPSLEHESDTSELPLATLAFTVSAF